VHLPRVDIHSAKNGASGVKVNTFSDFYLATKRGGVTKFNNVTTSQTIPATGDAIGAPTWTVTITPAGGGLVIIATGAVGDAVRWTASVEFTQVLEP
jgi:hypothetical protein